MNFLSAETRDQTAMHLSNSLMLTKTDDHYDDLNGKKNTYAYHDEIVKAVLYSGVDQLLCHRPYDFIDGNYRKSPSLLTSE